MRSRWSGVEPRTLAPRAPSERPTLLLLTSLPLVFPRAILAAGGGSPALTALKTRYRVVPISVTDQAELAKGRLLLMAHPLGPAGRRSGRARRMGAAAADGVLLLADPMLEWPSARPLGDPLRPPPMFMDTGLLGHWGLRLDAPDERGPVGRKLGGPEVLTVFARRACRAAARSAATASSRIARSATGQATIVADADLLDAERLGEPARHNLDALLAELGRPRKAVISDSLSHRLIHRA